MKRQFSYSRTFAVVLARDLKIAFKNKGDIFNPLLFFIIVITLFPLGIGPDLNTLAKIAAGIIWVAAVLSAMLSLERLFKADFDDGSLEQMLLSPQPLTLIIFAKVFAHWLITGLPVILLSPLLALLLNLPDNAYGALMLTLLLGTPILSLVGAIGVALTVALKKGGVLLSLLILPLYIPVLIFSTSAINAASLNMAYDGHLAIISALLATSLTLAPIAIGASLRVSTN
ncbi:heme exporter protein CcmB [Paraferrimonas sp. SM1919]|uniref:heme exporter protein CcmB n=1 Tax=Paraferrimonas sp. SM1919 TaxID=2662263 RepID=UPI0013D8219F|nr:heme exporter protein CcmB [Paraferrimonas sp. SM1919]